MSNGVRTALQGILLLVIAGLSYWLYRSVNDPWVERERQQQIQDNVRDRMMLNRQVLLRFSEVNNRFPQTLDSVLLFARTDSALVAESDSLFGGLNLDSLIFSPRTGNRFLYTASDTARPPYYKLTDPDNPEDFIGTDQGDITRINAASWE